MKYFRIIIAIHLILFYACCVFVFDDLNFLEQVMDWEPHERFSFLFGFLFSLLIPITIWSIIEDNY